MNPCPCGHFDDPERECTCLPGMVAKYQKRIAGPLLDRFNIPLEVQRVPIAKLASLSSGDLAGEESIRPLDLAGALQCWPRNLV
jgi:magnesium chelatase family protein